MASAPPPLIVRNRGADDGVPPNRYDFERPRSFSARTLRATEAAHAVMSERLAVLLSDRLGETVQVHVASVDEVQAVDFERSRTLPTAFFRTRLGAGGFIGIDVAPPLALFLVERHMGSADEMGADVRALSPLEQRVVERHWLPVVGAAFADAWGSAPPALERFDAHAGRLPLAPPATPVVVAELTVTVGPTPAALALAYPIGALRTLLAALTDDFGFSSDAPLHRGPRRPGAHPARPRPARSHSARSRSTSAPSSAGRASRSATCCTSRRATSFRSRAPEHAPVPVWIGDRLRFEAQPGLSGARIALHLTTPPAAPSPDASPFLS